ncbi:bifunctional 4-hydroxy-2-oxoglutarate aldolase/2-dehydro-3-deoxy-phosphogluconate aldolase [Clostridium sp.]|uniref:bifunctional 4-hydroxy-2-oxoglutarate aldolase/2-dehydro-3-deoxy-phosphogluconate aldolase n=1 Tax=Clostridium sp. TaxID=1506 RepID=UPI0025BA7C90|nr:bifunctional 4-hydroxy-2-oxoglutarate aldolase/2-dehydro-3-deoxy-phosphogluconate aldolase [Clostridium sp.]
MDMKEVFRENKILAIMRNVPLEKTIDYAQAIVDGGVKCFEVALNSKDAYKQIAMLHQYFGERALIGAGTAITLEKAKKALEAGAQFLLTPSTHEDVLAYCQKEKILFLPGALTPSEVATCLKYGFTTIKLFPAGDMKKGYIKSLKGPFDETDYVAIGGVDVDNIHEFFEQGYLAVGLGSNLMPKEIVLSNDWEKGKEYVAALVSKINKF